MSYQIREIHITFQYIYPTKKNENNPNLFQIQRVINKKNYFKIHVLSVRMNKAYSQTSDLDISLVVYLAHMCDYFSHIYIQRNYHINKLIIVRMPYTSNIRIQWCPQSVSTRWVRYRLIRCAFEHRLWLCACIDVVIFHNYTNIHLDLVMRECIEAKSSYIIRKSFWIFVSTEKDTRLTYIHTHEYTHMMLLRCRKPVFFFFNLLKWNVETKKNPKREKLSNSLKTLKMT